MSARGLIVSAPRSGGGKTTLTLALLAALRARGVAVQAAKAGPDYLDPGFHEAATGRPGVNLDSWAMPPALLDRLVQAPGPGASDLLVIEGAMGLFDGAGEAPGRRGSAADLASRYMLPVLLVLDVSGQAQSAAAVARGFATHEAGVRVGAVVLNRVGSERHRARASAAIEAAGLPVLGALPRADSVALPSRHLGLVQAGERADLADTLAALAGLAERHLDLDAILALAALLAGPAPGGTAPSIRPPAQRIAFARDAAFGFAYPHLLRLWREAGAEIVPFSPLADEPPDPSAGLCWLPGGYPELHAGRLASAATFMDGVRRFAASRPVHGECGGYMVLGQGIETKDGARHAMAGLLGHSTSMAAARLSLGYRRAVLLADHPLGPAGTALRGHEFHYARIVSPGQDAKLAAMSDAEGAPLPEAGGRRGLASGGFFHLIAPEAG